LNSKSLKKYGFGEWYAFSIANKEKILNILPYKKGVYILKYNSLVYRLKGKSDILYIGKTISGLNYRINFYFNPGPSQETSKRINSYLKNKKFGNLKISFKVMISKDRTRELEKKLLCRYDNDHEELPPWNRSA